MKIKDGFILRDVGDRTFVVATGELSKSFNGMITLNETGKFIWNLLAKGESKESIVAQIMNEFEDADRKVVEADVDAFIDKLVKDKVVE